MLVSRLIAWALVSLLVVAVLSGCRRTDPPPEAVGMPDTTSPPHEGTYGVTVLTDPETGCQYLTYYNKGITPRMHLDKYTNYTQAGCWPTMVNPVTGK